MECAVSSRGIILPTWVLRAPKTSEQSSLNKCFQPLIPGPDILPMCENRNMYWLLIQTKYILHPVKKKKKTSKLSWCYLLLGATDRSAVGYSTLPSTWPAASYDVGMV